MSLLDDARRLTIIDPMIDKWDNEGGHFECFACQGEDSVHAPDCSWLSIPRIVVALEAVNNVTLSFFVGSYVDDDGHPTVWTCTLCGHSAPVCEHVIHTSRCRIGTLADALRGEEVTV